MEKNNKNLTAKQRREQREAEAARAEAKAIKAEAKAAKKEAKTSEAPVVPASEEAVRISPSMSPRKRLLIIIGVIVAEAIIIFLAIFLPIAISPYRKVNNPVAVITLSNGYTLEFEIYEEQVPYAATNFIYLAKNKYFDGAIVYDMQNSFIRFGGFRDENYYHRSDDLDFAKKITDIPAREDGRKFVYRLKTDSNQRAKDTLEYGYLSFISSSATEFQLCAGENASLNVTNGDSYSQVVNGVSFARNLNDDTLSKIHSFYNSVYPSDGAAKVKKPLNKSYWWLPETKITIEKVKLYNLDKDKWRDFDYGKYLEEVSGNGWTG